MFLRATKLSYYILPSHLLGRVAPALACFAEVSLQRLTKILGLGAEERGVRDRGEEEKQEQRQPNLAELRAQRAQRQDIYDTNGASHHTQPPRVHPNQGDY